MARKLIKKKSPKGKKSVKKSVKNKTAKTKKKKVLAIPKGYNSLIPYFIVSNGAQAIEFYKKAFKAKLVMRMDLPNGKVGHAELKLGDSKMMLADECPEMGAKSPHSYGGSAMFIYFYTKKVDEVVKKAVQQGAKMIKEVEDMFYGDRSGMIEDPFGYKWCVATHIEDVTMAQLKKRSQEFHKK